MNVLDAVLKNYSRTPTCPRFKGMHNRSELLPEPHDASLQNAETLLRFKRHDSILNASTYDFIPKISPHTNPAFSKL
ncbi:MAG: hypothetical protein JWQ49_3809 [Edaphobacter sp.]|nr:hypothetical protein [Edaphobacter sp.]